MLSTEHSTIIFSKNTYKESDAAKKGIIHSIETCGAVDGPGIRYVIFFQGCPMRCKYCHNPDTWNLKSKTSKDFTVDELLEDIEKYKNFMKFSGGGVTVTGGEPLLQADFISELFKACKAKGIHTALDTSGYASRDQFEKVLPYTDLVMLDIKSIEPKTFKNITSCSIEPTLGLAEALYEKNIKTWIRFVLVPGLSDSKEELELLSEYISKMGNVELVEILPFHKLGEYKWEDLGLNYALNKTNEPKKSEVEAVKKIFTEKGIKVR